MPACHAGIFANDAPTSCRCRDIAAAGGQETRHLALQIRKIITPPRAAGTWRVLPLYFTHMLLYRIRVRCMKWQLVSGKAAGMAQMTISFTGEKLARKAKKSTLFGIKPAGGRQAIKAGRAEGGGGIRRRWEVKNSNQWVRGMKTTITNKQVSKHINLRAASSINKCEALGINKWHRHKISMVA